MSNQLLLEVLKQQLNTLSLELFILEDTLEYDEKQYDEGYRNGFAQAISIVEQYIGVPNA